ncbi:MAG TPA: hypothetical protein VFH78_02660 [Candidatus Thermoplasmatota archaeon]|nr:hypothetical protein [Candidatus Thermoplasmatota archaeon]
MGPFGPPEMMQQLGPGWDQAKRGLLLLLALLCGVILLLWWLDTRVLA